MRYRLRTLLIGTAALALPFARIGYLKQMAAFHRKQAEALISRAAKHDGHELEGVQYAVYSTLQLRPHVAIQAIREAPNDGSYWDCLCSAWSHEMIARKYDRATYRPWIWISETPEL
jgi:hypothetical protein